MKIGIIGTNDRAVAIGRLLAGCGHDVNFGHWSEESEAERAATAAGASAEIPYRQALTREMIVLAVGHDEIDATITALGSGIEARAVVDAVDGRPASDGKANNAEMLAHKLNSHRVVRALIVLPQQGANIPICGDDPIAKTLVEQAFAACNCVVTDRGPLSNAIELEPPRAA